MEREEREKVERERERDRRKRQERAGETGEQERRGVVVEVVREVCQLQSACPGSCRSGSKGVSCHRVSGER